MYVKNMMILEKYDDLGKFQVLEILEKSHKQDMKILVETYDEDSELKIIWNTVEDRFQAIIED